jgi:hypothetical protein
MLTFLGFYQLFNTGDSSESNNAVLRTYAFHKQLHPPFATRRVERNINAKLHRSIRSALGAFTRTNYRTIVKAALRSHVALRERLEVLQSLELGTITWEMEELLVVEERKRAAFQICQGIEKFEWLRCT